MLRKKMKMKILSIEKRFCTSCMEEHDVKRVEIQEENIFKSEYIVYPAEYYYCDIDDEYYAEDAMISRNGLALRNAYRQKMGLLTTDQIIAIRGKYGVSQSDLCIILGWGEKTITRYEGFQVQDAAHDSILRKLDNDPEWFLSLLEKSKDKIHPASYDKYRENGMYLVGKSHTMYLKNAIFSRYAPFFGKSELSGNIGLSLDKVSDVVRYFSNSPYVKSLYKVKLMKMIWYSDALSYKRYGHAITGLVYCALPMGAVPVAHELLISLDGINCEETEKDDGTIYNFRPTENKTYPNLTEQDRSVLDTIIERFGYSPKNDIVNAMHNEAAYKNTIPRDVIQFKYAEQLSLS